MSFEHMEPPPLPNSLHEAQQEIQRLRRQLDEAVTINSMQQSVRRENESLRMLVLTIGNALKDHFEKLEEPDGNEEPAATK